MGSGEFTDCMVVAPSAASLEDVGKEFHRWVISCEQLTETENYALWSRSMKIGLIGTSKLGFVDGRCTKDKFDRSLYELWEKCNVIFLSWIMNVVSKELLSGIMYKSSVHKLTDLWEEYDALMTCPGCDCPESKSYSEHFVYQRLLQFLMGLNESYAQPRSQNVMMSPVPSINKAYSMIVSEKSQRSLGKFTHDLHKRKVKGIGKELDNLYNLQH
ncbi:uncharacterized protein LOC142175843 [Nicotiana tabacum]|uniref:Uncharacterized protein LOC142175843 n=1 Tax=Nicotiana tabacum TaxID=4097 RepID=A0AC58TNY9_TOBAC